MQRPDDERGIQIRPDLTPEQLKAGGLIVGVEPEIRGSLISVAGAAIERITRERSEVPPGYRLPERPLYFLDPGTRRLIMISNRELRYRQTADKAGLFAEIVELTEDGKPLYRLSTSEIILPDENYQLVAVGPNDYHMPPSHMEVTEEQDEEEAKPKFVPWNVQLAQLQTWMNEVSIDPEESLDQFLKRFSSLRMKSEKEAQAKVKRAFPEGEQGFSGNVIPVNIIITNEDENGFLYQSSLRAGLFPFLAKPHDLSEVLRIEDPLAIGLEELPEEEKGKALGKLTKDQLDLFIHLGFNPHVSLERLDLPAVVTVDRRRLPYLADDFRDHHCLRIILDIQRQRPIFSVVDVPVDEKHGDNVKYGHGLYLSYNAEGYLGLLNKLKADLLLTMFLRGGEPIVK